jgi:D-sedoheptulose 7-phosphate isomerase
MPRRYTQFFNHSNITDRFLEKKSEQRPKRNRFPFSPSFDRVGDNGFVNSCIFAAAMNIVQYVLAEHLAIVQTMHHLEADIASAGQRILAALKRGNKIFLAGNGGSAADAQHIAAEFTGRFERERRGLPAMALTTDTSALTAISNDYGFERVYSRQIEALADPGDIFIAISTSGNSPNILTAIEAAHFMQMEIIGLSGRDGGDMRGKCHDLIVIPSRSTARIQEMHILVGHIWCAMVDG